MVRLDEEVVYRAAEQSSVPGGFSGLSLSLTSSIAATSEQGSSFRLEEQSRV